MKRTYASTGLAALGAGLIGWVALAWGQPNLGRLPPEDTPPAEPAPVALPDAKPMGPPPPVPGGPALTPPLPAPGPRVLGSSSPVFVPYNERIRTVGTTPEDRPRVLPAAAEERTPEPAAGPDNPVGRQEPAVSLEWTGPTGGRVGQPADYTVTVRNTCNLPVQQVMVRVRIPHGITVTTTKPKAYAEGNVLMWELGTLSPKQETNLQLRLLPDSKGDISCRAWVTFTGSAALQVRIREPKLLVKTSAPDRVLIGDGATFVVTVSNPGDGSVEQVKLQVALSDGLEHSRGPQGEFDIGTLNPGEVRTLQLPCLCKGGGLQKCDALAEGDGGLKSRDQAGVQVVLPRLDVEVSEARLPTAERKTVHTYKITNPADAAAANVTVTEMIPAGFTFASASDGGRYDAAAQTVSWFLGELSRGQAREVRLEVLAIGSGEFKHRATAVAARWTVR
jgi:uncharacterized repeat protein (TIGR01451 family)